MLFAPTILAQNSLSLALPETLFTSPSDIESEGQDPALLLRVQQLIRQTPAGEEITVCVFKFGVEQLAQDLIAAQERGVKVRIILNDGDTSKDANEDVAKLLKKKLADYHYIENDISSKGIIHNKFLLFSEVSTTSGTVSHVVVQTSSNFQKKGTKKLQDMVVFSNMTLYHGYLDFWHEIKVLGNAGQLDHYEYSTAEEEPYKAYFFPKIVDGEDHGKDNVLKALKDIEDPKNAKIHFAHGKWSDKRKEVIEALEDLEAQGAKVTVLTNDDLDKGVEEEFEGLEDNLVYLDQSFNMHTKFFLIDDGSSKVVWTGSHNLTERSLRENFEVLLRIDHPAVYAAYLDYFNEVLALGKL